MTPQEPRERRWLSTKLSPQGFRRGRPPDPEGYGGSVVTRGLRDAFKKFTPDTLVAEVKTSKHPWSRRGGIPDRDEVSFLPQGRVPALPLLQCG